MPTADPAPLPSAERFAPSTPDAAAASPAGAPRTATGRRSLLMLAKYWQPGLVKTRLAATIGPDAAAELHRIFVQHLSAGLSACADQRQILLWPADRCEAVADAVDSAWTVLPQGDGDLGQRMWRGFAAALTDPDPSAATLLIGADLPTLTAAEIDRAFAALDSHDVVLGPACDGGYYLIGLRGSMGAADQRLANLFAGIAWGTDEVLALTLRRAEQCKLRVALLQQSEDIDTQAELQRLIRRLAQAGSAADTALGEQLHTVLSRHGLTCLFSASTR